MIDRNVLNAFIGFIIAVAIYAIFTLSIFWMRSLDIKATPPRDINCPIYAQWTETRVVTNGGISKLYEVPVTQYRCEGGLVVK